MTKMMMKALIFFKQDDDNNKIKIKKEEIKEMLPSEPWSQEVEWHS